MSDNRTIQFLGFDFGTAYSFMAMKKPDETDPIILLSKPERVNMHRGIPSLFWNNSGNIIIGQQAEPAMWNDTANLVGSIKMKLTQKEPFVLNGQSFTAQEILEKEIAYVFDNAKRAAEEKYMKFPAPGTVRIVTGVPVMFGTYERELLADAIKKQGYEAEFLPEPVAAALNHAKMEKESFARALICDVGAGTFDAAFVVRNIHPTEQDPYPYKCIGRDGNYRAGDAIDKDFADYIVEHHSGRWTQEQIKRAKDPTHIDYRNLLFRLRKIKERLSDEEFVTDYVPLDGQAVEINVTLSDLEQAAADITQEIADKCYKVVKDCGMLDKNFPIILVGGSSNSPIIENALAKRFPRQAQKGQIKRRYPNQAVVMGCAFYAESHDLAHDVNYAYAIECFDNETQKQCLSIEIPAGVKLPYSAESHFMTKNDNQTSVDFRIFEVPGATEEDIVDVEEGIYNDIHIVHSFQKPVPKNTRVRCSMELTESGILNVMISDNGITGGVTRREFGSAGIIRLQKGMKDHGQKQKKE